MSKSLLLEAKQMLLACAPELRGQRLYVVDAEMLRDLPCNNGQTYGWADTSQTMDLNVADRIPEYSGPGSLIVLDLQTIADEAPAGEFERCVRNVIIHEVGHVLPSRKVSEPTNLVKAREWQAARMATDFQKPVAEPTDPHDSHDHKFVRRVTHVYYRARLAGFDVPPSKLFGPQLWLSRTEFYVDALLPELAKFSCASFAEIEQAPAPAAFDELWQADLRDYHRMFTKGN